jgi:hypothetical protein
MRRSVMRLRLGLALVSVLWLSCASPRAVPGRASASGPEAAATISTFVLDAAAGGDDAGVATLAQRDPDGNDDPEDPGMRDPKPGRFVRVGQAPMALQRICDLTPLKDALIAAHARQPLGIDGATLTRYRPEAVKPFSVAFDWNRPGEPTKGGGAGQGFLRAHAIDGRLYVPDADPPYGGLGLVDWGTEGYVFMSDEAGKFAPPRAPHYRPPAEPKDGGAGAGVLPRAYHVLDVIKFRGHLYASTGSVPPKERAWSGPSPGALHIASENGSRWTYAAGYPVPYQNGVWRLTFMTRFHGRLYAGIQDFEGRDPHSYVTFAPEGSRDVIEQDDVHPVQAVGAAQTLRWFTDRGKLYWIAVAMDGSGTRLRVTEDGEQWTEVKLPSGVGKPTDLARVGSALVVLTEQALVRIDGAEPLILGTYDGVKKSPFVLDNYFCTAPLAVFQNRLYAGSQRDGSLWAWEESP